MKKVLLFALLLNATLIAGRLLHDVVAQAQDGRLIRNGDVNADGTRDISDARYMLNWLFLGGPEPVAIAGEADLEMRVEELEEIVAELVNTQPSVAEIAAELAANHADALRGEEGPPGPQGKPGAGGSDPVADALESLALLLDEPEVKRQPPSRALLRTAEQSPATLIVDSEPFGQVVGGHVVEEVSTLPVAHVVVETADTGLNAEDLVGREARLDWQMAGSLLHFRGEIDSAAVASTTSRSLFVRVTIVTRFHRLSRGRGSRVWQDVRYSDVVQNVLSDHGLSGNIEASPITREYVVQYQESDWNFVSRLLEEEGIFYYFEHSTSGARFNTTSASGGAPDIPGVYAYRGHEAPPNEVGEAYVRALSVATNTIPREVEVRGWDYVRKQTVVGEATAAPGVDGTHREFVGELREVETVDLDAAVVRDRLLTERTPISGTSTIPCLRPGGLLTLAGSGERFNGKYFVTGVTHSFATTGDGLRTTFHYGNKFQVIPIETPFRPARKTRKPVMQGPQTAIVVGVAGEEVFTDQYARVKVKFPWLDVPNDEHASPWIRITAPGAGNDRGLVCLPEIDDEVLVGFVNGDVNHPVVLGGLWNGVDDPPTELPSQNDSRVLKSRSGHLLVFDDTAGAETVQISSVKDFDIASEQSLQVLSGLDLDVASSGRMTMSGGANVHVASSATLDLQAGAMLEMSSALTRINTGNLLVSAPVTQVAGRLSSGAEAGPVGGVNTGDRLRDNAVVAWARVAPTGLSGTARFGVVSTERLRAGVYAIEVSAKARTASELIPIVVPDVPAAPRLPGDIHFVSVSQQSATSFEVYVSSPEAAAVDGGFVFMATAR